jgi:uncharacterized membrane protein
MAQKGDSLREGSMDDVDVAMKKASSVIASAAAILMLGGLLWFWADRGLSFWPGDPVTPLIKLIHPSVFREPLPVMSAGLGLLSLLPGLRILLALGIYLRRRKIMEGIVAAIVLLELLLSMAGIGW